MREGEQGMEWKVNALLSMTYGMHWDQGSSRANTVIRDITNVINVNRFSHTMVGISMVYIHMKDSNFDH